MPTSPGFRQPRRLGERDRRGRDRAFVGVALAGDVLDGVSIAIARGLVRVDVSARRIAPEDLLDEARTLEELVPVERADGPHAGDGIADRDLIRRLAQVLPPGELLRREPELRALRADPVVRVASERVVLPQSTEDLHEKRRRRGSRIALELDQRPRHGGRAVGGGEQARGPLVAAHAVLGAGLGRGARGHREDEAHPEHDGHRPELTRREGADRLVGEDVARQGFELDPRVGVPEIIEA